MSLSREQRLYFAQDLRFARRKMFEDAEAYDEVLFALERLGKHLKPDGLGLGNFRDAFCELLASDLEIEKFIYLFQIVKDGRNDAFHTGAAARKLGQHSLNLALKVETALLDEVNMNIEDVMSEGPICAEDWQQLSLIRRNLLANSFSFLPYQSKVSEGEWKLISDFSMATYLLNIDSKRKRMTALSAPLSTAIELGLDLGRNAAICFFGESVANVIRKCDGLPVIVLNKETKQVIGIATPFDFL